MTATTTTMFSIERPSPWNMLFADESDKDLDFDEGFEEDELHDSKPPSRRPLILILLLVLVGAIAYWALNDRSTQSPRMNAIETVEEIKSAPQKTGEAEMFPPIFREGQIVMLTDAKGVSMLMGDPNNSQPGPLIDSNEHFTILDGLQQIHGWVYFVKTSSGKTGWISEEKLKKES